MKRARKPTGWARKAYAALRLAVRGVIADHRKTGHPLVIWRNGKVVRVPVDRVVTSR